MVKKGKGNCGSIDPIVRGDMEIQRRQIGFQWFRHDLANELDAERLEREAKKKTIKKSQ